MNVVEAVDVFFFFPFRHGGRFGRMRNVPAIRSDVISLLFCAGLGFVAAGIRYQVGKMNPGRCHHLLCSREGSMQDILRGQGKLGRADRQTASGEGN